ncbi:deoxycytidylate deaminase [Nocardia sp. NPDC055002]
MAKPTWTEYYLGFAEAASKRSSCVRSKVGAVIVKGDRIVSAGYNDSPAGTPGCESCPRRDSGCAPGSSYDTGPAACVALHAEQNAIIRAAPQDREGADLYVTRAPCDGCAKLIAGSGVRQIIWPEGRREVRNP